MTRVTLDLVVVLVRVLIDLLTVRGFFDDIARFWGYFFLSLDGFRADEEPLALELLDFFVVLDLDVLLRDGVFDFINSLSFYFLAANFSFFFASATDNVIKFHFEV